MMKLIRSIFVSIPSTFLLMVGAAIGLKYEDTMGYVALLSSFLIALNVAFGNMEWYTLNL